ncbi:hypothetical protein KGF54_004700 [Candida jiufengensis]|uniref:uncharacterized protein n=1 Tax=Candida jiufengensis TaxID=497108 RepID=UPI0022255052|nr:uncharacterized protein KGF54_004700 [Candida jiufengensis]KAI5951626.1 hypothetical protein KGF54_004700 [Candida jiufengensis]
MSKSLPINGKDNSNLKSSTPIQSSSNSNSNSNGKAKIVNNSQSQFQNNGKLNAKPVNGGNSQNLNPTPNSVPKGIKIGSNPGPEELFELLSKNYENWSQAMTKQFEDEENFSPFPNENDNELNKDKMNPIFNYSLLEALETASNEIGDKLKDIPNGNIRNNTLISKTTSSNTTTNGSIANRPIKHPKRRILHPSHSLLNEKEIVFLRDKITQIIKEREGDNLPQGFTLYDTNDEKGLNNDDDDEEELCSCCDHSDEDDEYEEDHDQNDYDLNDFTNNNDNNNDKRYSNHHINSRPTHSIEIELNTAPDCEVHGSKSCDCPIFDSPNNNELERMTRRKRNYMGSPSDNDYDSNEGPSCEFTFEYDHNGQLIPTYNNIEEKLRLMRLESSMKINNKLPNKNKINNKFSSGKNNNSKTVQPKQSTKQSTKQDNKPNQATATNSNTNSKANPKSSSPTKTKTKKTTKTKSKSSNSASPNINPLNDLKKLQTELPNDILKKYRLRNLQSTTPKNFYGLIPNDSCCLLCQYEAIFGCKPKYIYSKK